MNLFALADEALRIGDESLALRLGTTEWSDRYGEIYVFNRAAAPVLAAALKELVVRIDAELLEIAMWAAENSYGGDFADQVRQWALSRQETLARFGETPSGIEHPARRA